MSITGAHPAYRPPDWRPLERALSLEFGTAAADASASFWFIGFIAGPDDVGELRLYEHSETRRRLALDGDGNAYRWSAMSRRYFPVEVGEELVSVLL